MLLRINNQGEGDYKIYTTDYKIQKIYAFRLTYTTINRSKAKMDGKNNEPHDVSLRLVW